MGEKDRIEGLEQQVERLQQELSDVRRQLASAELDVWRGRIDDLELQARLGSMSVQDRLLPVVEELRNTWLDARAKVADGAGTASEVGERLRKGLEQAMDDVRAAVGDARNSVSVWSG
jgi:predicted  nucleic acid-binding Zn-ribbon protein